MCSSFTMTFRFKKPWAKNTSADVFLDAAKHTWAAKKRDRYDNWCIVDIVWIQYLLEYTCTKTTWIPITNLFYHWSVSWFVNKSKVFEWILLLHDGIGWGSFAYRQGVPGGNDILMILGKVLSSLVLKHTAFLETRGLAVDKPSKKKTASLYHRRMT